MTGRYILAIDQGTTGSTALIIDFHGGSQVIGRATVDFKQHYPKPGWVEHDLDEIWQSVGSAVRKAVSAAEERDAEFAGEGIAGIGITNQRETVGVFEKGSGKPLARAIVWQCRRSTEICREIRGSAGLEASIKEKTGLVVDPYFSGTKLRWLVENDAELAAKVGAGKALFGTIDAYLLYRLTAGRSFKTEPSNASRTMLVDIRSGQYDDELLALMKIPSRDVLPEIVDSVGEFGRTSGCDFLRDGIPISGILGDQQAALAGQTCFAEGEAKCTYGTGAFLLLNTGNNKLNSNSGLLTTVAWSLGGKLTYAFEGSAFIAGASVQFIRDQLKFIDVASQSAQLAAGQEAAPGLYFVPALAGLGAPIWDPEARGAFLGLTRGTSIGELTRATLEGIALQVCDLVRAMDEDFPGAVEVLRVDGGACANDLLMQIQANFAELPVERPRNLETTAFGAALFAALGIGICRSIDELKDLRLVDRQFEPEASFSPQRPAILAGWQRAIGAVRHFGSA